MVRMIPPLRILTPQDVKHLNDIPLDIVELHGRTGRNSDKRRLARKTWADLTFLMGFVHDKVVERGAFTDEITLGNVDRMFLSVVEIFNNGSRDAQKRWTTVVNALRLGDIK